MSIFPLPSWLQPIYPGWFTDARTGRLMPLTDEEVARVCQQHQSELLQRWQSGIQQQQAQQFSLGAGQQYPHYQTHKDPMYNYCTANVGSLNISGHQSGHGNHNFGNQRIRYQRQAPLVSQNNAIFYLGGQVPIVPAKVQTVEPQVPRASVVPSAFEALDVIDLTVDEAANEPGVASQPTISKEVKAAPEPGPKPVPKFWNAGSMFLTRKLNNVGNSNQYFLFGSLSEIEPKKRNKYAAAHWTFEEAAYNDILEMSQYFIDASEMMSYRLKWDAIESDLASGRLSNDEEEDARDELAEEKRRLQSGLNEKRQIKLDRVEKAQYSPWVDKMKRVTFVKKFGVKAIKANREKVKRNFGAELDAQRAEERAPKKARAQKAGGSQPSARTERKAESKAGGTRAYKAKPKSQTKSKNTTPTPAADAFSLLLPCATMEAFRPFSPSPSPELFNKPGSADLEITDDPSTSERRSNTAHERQMHEGLPEHVTAPTEPEIVWATEEELLAEFEEQGTVSTNPDPKPWEENTVVLQEQAAAPSLPSPPPASCVSPSVPQDGNIAEQGQAIARIPLTHSPAPMKQPRWSVTGSLLSDEPEKEPEALHEDEGYDSLFEDDDQVDV